MIDTRWRRTATARTWPRSRQSQGSIPRSSRRRSLATWSTEPPARRSAELLAEAAELARTSPCDPKTLTRAARDFAASKPEFARSVLLAALQWLLCRYGYDQRTGPAARRSPHRWRG